MSSGSVTDFRVGHVFARGFGVLARLWIPFGLVTIVIMSPTFLYAIFVDPTHFAERSVLTVETMIWGLIDSGLGIVAASVMTHATIRELRGGRAEIGESIGRGIAVLFPMIGIAIVFLIGTTLGLLLLIVPGIYLMTIWWVVVPAAVVERTGVFESFVRSSRLTAGNRWRVVAILVVVYGSYFLISEMILTMLANSVGRIADTIAYILVYFAAMVIVTMVDTVLGAVAYHDLRILKEGDYAERIAAVFD